MAKLTLETYWRSSCSYRVRIALGAKGLAYEPVFVNILEGEQKTPEYLAKNPIGHVPTLTIETAGARASYVESVAIMELLEELYPEPALLPRTPHERALVRALVQTVNAGIQPLQNTSVLGYLGPDPEARSAWLKHWLPRGLTAFESLMANAEKEGVKGPFAFGTTLSMADCCIVPQIYAARRFGIDLAPFPRIVRAEAAAMELPFVLAAKPEAQPDAKL